MSLYRAPKGEGNQFIGSSDGTLKYLCNSISKFIICGYINTDHPNRSYQNKATDLISNIQFTTYSILCNRKSKQLDYCNWQNIFMHYIRLNSAFTSPTVNSLSGNGAQFLTINNIYAATNAVTLKQKINVISNKRISDSQNIMENETGEYV